MVKSIVDAMTSYCTAAGETEKKVTDTTTQAALVTACFGDEKTKS